MPGGPAAGFRSSSFSEGGCFPPCSSPGGSRGRMAQRVVYNPDFLPWLASLNEAYKYDLLDADPAWQAHLAEMCENDREQASYERGDYAPPPRE